VAEFFKSKRGFLPSKLGANHRISEVIEQTTIGLMLLGPTK